MKPKDEKTKLKRPLPEKAAYQKGREINAVNA